MFILIEKYTSISININRLAFNYWLVKSTMKLPKITAFLTVV